MGMEIERGLYISLEKSITRDQAKKVHDKLPEGGTWRTVRGHHVYIKDGKILAGAWGGAKGDKPQKSTKNHISTLQAEIDKDKKVDKPKSKKPAAPAKGKAPKQDKKVDKKVDKKAPVTPKKTVKTSTKPSTKPTPKSSKETIKDVLGYKPVDGKKKTSAKVKEMNKKATQERKAIKQNKKEHDRTANPLLTVSIKPKSHEEVKAHNINNSQTNKQNAALEQWKANETDQKLDAMWNSSPVKNILAKPANKRSEAEIRKVAGAITQAQDNLARHITLRMGEKRGMELARQVNK